MDSSKKTFRSIFLLVGAVVLIQFVAFAILSNILSANMAVILAGAIGLVAAVISAFLLSQRFGSAINSVQPPIDAAALQVQHAKALTSERERVLATVASQVAHDVRSPLAALETVLANTKGIEEEKRVMLRTATKRIKDMSKRYRWFHRCMR